MKTFQLLLSEILASGLTQIDVAKALNISQATVSEIYRGVRDDPKVSIADGIRALHAERCKQQEAA